MAIEHSAVAFISVMFSLEDVGRCVEASKRLDAHHGVLVASVLVRRCLSRAGSVLRSTPVDIAWLRRHILVAAAAALMSCVLIPAALLRICICKLRCVL